MGTVPAIIPAGLLQLLHDGHGRDGQGQDDGGLFTIDCREMTNTEESVCLSVCLSVCPALSEARESVNANSGWNSLLSWFDLIFH